MVRWLFMGTTYQGCMGEEDIFFLIWLTMKWGKICSTTVLCDSRLLLEHCMRGCAVVNYFEVVCAKWTSMYYSRKSSYVNFAQSFYHREL